MSNEPEEVMTVDLELEDGRKTTCEVITVLEVDGKEYIALLPEGQDPDSDENEVWFYGLKEDASDPNAEPELIYIDSDDEYEAVTDKFEEWLDDAEFDED